MKQGGFNGLTPEQTKKLVADLYAEDCTIADHKLQQILSFGKPFISYLETILKDAFDQKNSLKPGVPRKTTDWFVVIHGLFLLAHLKSEKSLTLVLEFFSQKEEILNYWFQDLLDDDAWEIFFLLGQNQLDEMETFVLNRLNNQFSRLSACTALIQIALADSSKLARIRSIIVKLLTSRNEDPDFIGLAASEASDLLDEDLQPYILNALVDNEVWPGIISVDDVNKRYQNNRKRQFEPLDIFQRYDIFRQHAYFATTRQELDSAEKKQKKSTSTKSIKS